MGRSWCPAEGLSRTEEAPAPSRLTDLEAARSAPQVNAPAGWTTAPRPVERRNAADAVLADLRTAVETGNIHVGSRLPAEKELAALYEVSRTVIREALHALRTLGLTETKTGSGTFVVARRPQANPRLGAYSARDLLEARPAVEIPAAGLAAARRSSAQMQDLQTLIERMEVETDPARWVALDGDFHVAIAQASGNAVFEKILADALEALTLQSNLIGVLTDRSARIVKSNDEHRAVVEAIAAEDSALAEATMRTHLANVADIVSVLLDEEAVRG